MKSLGLPTGQVLFPACPLSTSQLLGSPLAREGFSLHTIRLLPEASENRKLVANLLPPPSLCPLFSWANSDGSQALWGAPLLACWGSAFLHTPTHYAYERCPPRTPRVSAHGSWPRPLSPPAPTITAASLTGLPTAVLTHIPPPNTHHSPMTRP